MLGKHCFMSSVTRRDEWRCLSALSRTLRLLEPNPERPCMRVTSKESKAAFFSLTKPLRPEEWPTYNVGTKTRMICRVLDLRTLAWALFNEQHSLKSACKVLRTKNQKLDYEPTGTVSKEELSYARQDVRCSVDLLNALKNEFGLHPIKLHPDKAVSPASIGKAYPAGKDPSNFGLIMPFSKHREEWLKTKAIDTHSGKPYSICLLDPKGRTKKIEVKCYGNILGSYREHPEAKFLGSDGEPCNKLTRGLLRRSHIVANQHRYIGKETSRKWEQGDDPSLVDFQCAEYSDGKTVADEELKRQILEFGIRKTARATRTDSKTIMLIARRERVKPSTLAKLREFFRKGENGNHAL